MSDAKWTEAPWQVCLTAAGDYDVRSHTHTSAVVSGGRVFNDDLVATDLDGYFVFSPGVDFNQKQEANAHLIAAAPELYEALEGIIEYTRACEALLNASESGHCINAKAALAKARGES